MDGYDIDVVIAILTWRGEDATRTCLESLSRGGHALSRILVIDNGSGTGEGAKLGDEFGVQVLTLDTNGGVPAGYNAGIAWARDHGASHVLLANNDLTFADPDVASKLAALAAPDVAAIGPIIRNSHGSIVSAGGRLHRWLGHVERTRTPWNEVPYAVDALDGSCFLVSLDAACSIGGLEPQFFLYWEETDWCARARRRGLRLLIDPDASVTHVGIGSGNMRQTRRYALRNSLLFIRRNVHGAPGLSAGLAWLFGKVPLFVARRLTERANPLEVLRDATWAFSFHVRDIARSGWKRPATGPDICQ